MSLVIRESLWSYKHPPLTGPGWMIFGTCRSSFHRRARIFPRLPPSGHRPDIRVAQLLQHIGSQSGAIASTAIQDQFGRFVRHAGLDVAFDYAFAEVLGAGGVSGPPFIVFANV